MARQSPYPPQRRSRRRERPALVESFRVAILNPDHVKKMMEGGFEPAYEPPAENLKHARDLIEVYTKNKAQLQ